MQHHRSTGEAGAAAEEAEAARSVQQGYSSAAVDVLINNYPVVNCKGYASVMN